VSKPASFDAANYLDSPKMIAAYLNEAFESEDPALIAMAIGVVARAWQA
jgi:probable addiction module antidote protein